MSRNGAKFRRGEEEDRVSGGFGWAWRKWLAGALAWELELEACRLEGRKRGFVLLICLLLCTLLV